MSGPVCSYPPCGAEYSPAKQDFITDHVHGCPYDQRVHIQVEPKVRPSNEDKKSAFSDCWPGRWPGYETEYRFHSVRKWRFDFAWPDYLVAVEVDGNAWHVPGGGSHMQDGDLNKLNTAASMGWTVFRFSPGMLKKDPNLVSMVHKFLETRYES